MHHKMVLGYLDALGVVYENAPRLVRGLDYYVRTTFELVHDGLGAQSAIGGGGRYDGLIETLGGSALPGVGFGLGVDRTCLAVQAEGIELPNTTATQVFVIALGELANTVAVQLVGNLRTSGISTDMSFDSRSIKAAMKGADRCGARFAIIIGEDEVAARTVVLKDLESGEQESLPIDLCPQTLLTALSLASHSPKE